MKKKIFIIVCAICAIMFSSINIDKNSEVFWNTNSSSVLSMAYCMFMYYIIQQCEIIKDRRLKICAIILACFFATIEVIGYSLNYYLDLSNIFCSRTAILKNGMKWVGYAIIFYTIIVFVFDKLNNLIEKRRQKENKNVSFFTSNKKSFFICMGIIILAWLPYILRYFPGNVSYDSLWQILQATGVTNFNNHHPVIHTSIIWLTMSIGKMFGNYNVGIAIYSIIQMLIMSAIFSFVIYYMAKKNISISFRIVTLIFFAIYPINAIYSITMWKDIIFSGFVVLVIIQMIEIVTNTEVFFQKKKNIILFILSLIIMSLFRNNGIYVTVFAMPFLIITVKKYYRILLIAFLVVLVICGIIKGPIFEIFNINSSSIREALSVPLQQFARVVVVRGDVTIEEKEAIYNFLPIEDYVEVYNPTISDPIKAKFNEEYFYEHKMEFVGLWIKIVLKYPVEVIEAFLCNSFGYWYPETQYWKVYTEIYQEGINESSTGLIKAPFDIHKIPLIKGKLIDTMVELIDNKNIPIISMLFSIGFAFFIVIISFMYLYYKKRYKELIIYVPIIVLWFTCMASPVHCEFRYIYSMFISLPSLISINLIKNKEISEGK